MPIPLRMHPQSHTQSTKRNGSEFEFVIQSDSGFMRLGPSADEIDDIGPEFRVGTCEAQSLVAGLRDQYPVERIGVV